MMTRRGANAAPDLSTTHPTSEIIRLRDRSDRSQRAQRHDEAPRDAATSASADEDDLYGNMPFTD
jgi:hypothetical protein